jgi:hypothetical protein
LRVKASTAHSGSSPPAHAFSKNYFTASISID